MFYRFAMSLLALALVSLSGIAGADEKLESVDQIRHGLIPITGDDALVPSVNLQVSFELGSARLTGSARKQLDFLGQALVSDELAGYQFSINGHTDATGSRAMNQRLSEQRARAVKSYLVSRFDLSPDRLVARGFGEDRLRFADKPEDGRNRRVEIVNLGHVPVGAPALKPPPPREQTLPPPGKSEDGITAIGAD